MKKFKHNLQKQRNRRNTHIVQIMNVEYFNITNTEMRNKLYFIDQLLKVEIKFIYLHELLVSEMTFNVQFIHVL